MTILTKDQEIIDSTFIDKYKSGVYSKKVSEEKLEEIYTYETYGIVENCKVNIEKEEEKYCFVGTGDCKVAEIVGLSRCNKYYYERKKEEHILRN